MRTTIRLPDGLYDEVRQRAHDERRTVTSLIEEALRDRLDSVKSAVDSEFVVDAFEGTGILPGIDLVDSASLLEAMER